MEVIKTLKPGQSGTKKLVEHYGSSLVAVRYRLDKENDRQLTTIELVIDERDPAHPGICRCGELHKQRLTHQAVKIEYDELDLRQAIKRAGGRWDARQKVWWLKQEDVVAMRLLDRVVEGLKCPDIDIF